MSLTGSSSASVIAMIPNGLCQCGCGQATTIIARTYSKRGWFKGQFYPYAHGHALRGRPRSDETKSKIAMAQVGRKASLETRAKLSAARAGKPNPASRRSPSIETRDKISKALTGRTLPAEQIEALSVRMKGSRLSPVCYEKLKSPEVQARRLAGLRTAFARRPKKLAKEVLTKEQANAKRQVAIKEAFKRPEVKARRSAAMKARLSDPVVRAAAVARLTKNSSELRRAWWAALTPEKREELAEKRRASHLRRWANLTDEQKQAHANKTKPARLKAIAASKVKWSRMSAAERLARMRPMWAASLTANPSSIERTVAALLDSLGVVYVAQQFIGPHVVDFYVPSKRLVIECDGSYWHSLPGRPENDARRDAYMAAHGFTVLRLPEADIKSGTVLELLKGIA